jgi:hypothetical protein
MSSPIDLMGKLAGIAAHGPFVVITAMGDRDSLLFNLWNGDTRKVIARGSGVLMRQTEGDASQVANPLVFSALARQILRKLNQLF